MNIIPTVGIVVFKGDDVLMVEHKEGASNPTGIYGIPAGRINSGENARQAATRELKEETGLIVADNDLIELPTEYTAVLERKDGSKREFHMEVFLAQIVFGDLSESDETIPKWINRAMIDRYKLMPNVENAIREAENFK